MKGTDAGWNTFSRRRIETSQPSARSQPAVKVASMPLAWLVAHCCRLTLLKLKKLKPDKFFIGKPSQNYAHCCHMGAAIKHHCALSPERQSARMSKITNDGLTRSGTMMLYSCTHMATVSVKGLIQQVVVEWREYAASQ